MPRRPCLHIRCLSVAQWPQVSCRDFSFGVKSVHQAQKLRPLAVRVLMLEVCDRLPYPAFSREGHLLKAKEAKVPRSEPE